MKKINVKTFTQAPEQLVKTRLIQAPIEEVWKIIANHEGMTQWMPMISHVALVKEDANGNWGEGCERACQFGPDLLEEKIVFWDEPHGYAYMISDMHLVKNHLGHISLVSEEGGTRITWKQYFDLNGNFVKKFMAKQVMMPAVMAKALKNLEKKLIA